MVHWFVWWAVIWFLEMYCGAQDIKTFQLHLGAVSQICSWWKLVQFQRFCWFVCCVELSARKADTVNSSFIQYKRCTLFKSLEKVSLLSVRPIRRIRLIRSRALPEVSIWIFSWVPVSVSPFTLTQESVSSSQQGCRVLGFPCIGRQSRGTPNSLTPARAAKLKLFTVSLNISQSLQNNHWSFISTLYN